MPTLLSDPPFVVYLVLCAGVLALGAVWISQRDRRSLIAMSICGLLLLVVVLIDRVMESPREESVRRAAAMVAAADARDPIAFVAQVADTVDVGTDQQSVRVTREQLRTSGFWSLLKQYNVRVTAWDYSRSHVREIDANTIAIGFMAKGEADGKPYPVFVRVTFARQANGEFKLIKFGTFSPTNHDEALRIPNFP